MSFALPSLKSKPEQPDQFGFNEGSFGVPTLMNDGMISAKSDLEDTHPLAHSELNYRNNVNKMNMAILRNIQGIHAPLRIAMELKAAKKVGRLPFLSSSNIMQDTLTGRDLEVGPEDVFNLPELSEVAGQPHAIIERSLGLL